MHTLHPIPSHAHPSSLHKIHHDTVNLLLAQCLIYRDQFRATGKRIRLSDAERMRLYHLGMKLGSDLKDNLVIVELETFLRWPRKCQGALPIPHRRGRPPTPSKTVNLILRMAQENPAWGYTTISNALTNLGMKLCPNTVGNILRRNGIPPAPKRRRYSTWKRFLRRHFKSIWATDFFVQDIQHSRGTSPCHILVFIHQATRKVVLGGITFHPTDDWMRQAARNFLMRLDGCLEAKYLIHDRDAKFTAGFEAILKDSGIEPLTLPPMSPNLNAYVERWIRSIKEQCLRELSIQDENELHHVVCEYISFHQRERNHQGLNHKIPFPDERLHHTGEITTSSRLDGLLNYYHRLVA